MELATSFLLKSKVFKKGDKVIIALDQHKEVGTTKMWKAVIKKFCIHQYLSYIGIFCIAQYYDQAYESSTSSEPLLVLHLKCVS